MTGTCTRCNATVEVRTMKSLLLLGEPDETMLMAVSHTRPRTRASGQILCEGSNEEVPVPYVPRLASVVETHTPEAMKPEEGVSPPVEPMQAPTPGSPAGSKIREEVIAQAPRVVPRRNPYASAGRAEKVRKLIAAIDAQARTSPHAPKSPQEAAERLAEVDMPTWAKFAAQIGVNAPNAETVAEVLTVFRARAIQAAETAPRQAVAG